MKARMTADRSARAAVASLPRSLHVSSSTPRKMRGLCLCMFAMRQVSQVDCHPPTGMKDLGGYPPLICGDSVPNEVPGGNGQNRTLSDAAFEARRNPNYAPIDCAYCGTSFKPYRLVNNRFCSTPCRKRSRRVTTRAEKVCPSCRSVFTPEKSMKQRFCGSQCKSSALRALIKSDQERAEKRRASQKAYSRTEAYRISQRSAKARRRTAEKKGRVTVAEWKAIVTRFHGACAYCGAQNVKLTMDHVVPLAKGGAHSPGNVVPACGPCNSAKCDRDWSDKLPCP